ncbi:MAG: hypothetical protein E7608_05715 [Ruminococcaceae bacterium]|nr:hypothetical protein [Oscillospiraceae bacterium]
MKKKLSVLLLVFSLILLVSCGNLQSAETTSQTTDTEKTLFSDIAVHIGEKTIVPFLAERKDNSTLFYSTYIRSAQFYKDKENFPVVYCKNLDDIKFYVKDVEQTDLEIKLINEGGYPASAIGSGLFFAYTHIKTDEGTCTPIIAINTEEFYTEFILTDEPVITVSSTDFNKNAAVYQYTHYISPYPYIKTQTFSGIGAEYLFKALESMIPSGETAYAISESILGETPNQVLENAKSESLLTVGTSWIETEDAIYRIEGSKIAKVESLLGAGEYMKQTADFFEVFNVLINYYPQNTYIGKATPRKITLNHICENEKESDISVNVKDIRIPSGSSEPGKRTFIVTLELTSPISTDTVISYSVKPQSDVIPPVEKKTISLDAGVPKTVTIRYSAYKTYAVYFKIDNTLIEIS